MKRYGFQAPPGWIRRPFPPPQTGIYLTAPAGTPRASILLMAPIGPCGAVLDQIETVVSDGCVGTELLERAAPAMLAPGGLLPGAFATARVRVVHDGRVRDELRWFALFEGLFERLPVVFLGDVDALARHRAALDGVVGSLDLLSPAGESLY